MASWIMEKAKFSLRSIPKQNKDVTFFNYIDILHLSRLNSWYFYYKSLTTKYGLDFITKVILKYPFRVIQGIQKYQNETPSFVVNNAHSDMERWKSASNKVVGLGFCLKPLEPECVSGRFNHDCYYLENNLQIKPKIIPASCQQCAIRKIGALAFKANISLYIMTSAEDILHDLLLPCLHQNGFDHALLAICSYSYEPIKVAFNIVGFFTKLFTFQNGDCQDYKMWRKADLGFKDENTCFSTADYRLLCDYLKSENKNILTHQKFIKQDNIFNVKTSCVHPRERPSSMNSANLVFDNDDNHDTRHISRFS
ncbi:hypothetical protein GF406_22440 [candidate division KSB1 bacterium]|nr:hypothetical protein [candidate division KSB1 bacterium]